jgi:hypothetical protein
MLRMTSTARLSRTLCGWAAIVRSGLEKVARLAIWCAQVVAAPLAENHRRVVGGLREVAREGQDRLVPPTIF